MKIVHVSLCGPVTDNFTYQDNILPKFQARLGHELVMITSQYVFNSNGDIVKDSRSIYYNEYNIKTIRLKIKGKKTIMSKLKKYLNLYEVINQEKPDIVFVHGVQFKDISTIVKYLKLNRNIINFVDNHADFSNSAKGWLSKNILHKIIWRYYAHKINPYTRKFYGVLPARVEFLKSVYKLPESKIEFLPLGADDDYISRIDESENNKIIRKKHSIQLNDFLIISGGKIDLCKRQILTLLKAVKAIDNERVKLIIFGPIVKELIEETDKYIDGIKIIHLEWLNVENSYNYFSASNLVVFPGRHSVYWEQVVAIGIPMLVKYWEGTTHIDIGGNVEYIYEDNVDEIKHKIENLVFNDQDYLKMKNIAKSNKKTMYLYSNIAKQSIESVKLN